jgi:hypothetical protein
LRVERSLVSIARRGGTFVVRGGRGALVGAQPISIEVKNISLGTSVPVVVVSEEGAFETTINAAPGDRLSIRAVSGVGEQIEIGLGQVPVAEPQAFSRPRSTVRVDQLHLVSSLIIVAPAAARMTHCEQCASAQRRDQPRRTARMEDMVQGVIPRRRKFRHTFKAFQALHGRDVI